MKNLKIRAKLILGFSIIVILTSIGGVVGTVSTSRMEAASTNLYDHEVKPLIDIFGALDNIERIRIQMRDLILNAGDREKVSSLETGIKNILANFETVMENYDQTIVEGSGERSFFDNAKNMYAVTIKPGVLDVLEVAESGVDQQALLFMVGELTDAAETIVSDLNKCIDFRKSSAAASVESTSALARSVILGTIVALVISIVIAFVLAIMISGMISKPLVHMSDFLEKVRTTGDMTFSEEEQATLSEDMKIKDEIGRCVNACSSFVLRVQELNEKTTRLAAGDLTMEMEILSEKDSIGLAFTNMITNLNTMFSEVRTASDQVSSGAEQVSRGAQALASGSSQQAASIEEFSASLTELREKTKNNAEHSMNAAKVNEKMGFMIQESVLSMTQMMGAMKEIDESSKNITRVIKVIDDIAFQTNILALNAAVEAARAGQHGKGFAVVADEVRNLAAKSAEAAKETADLIKGSSEKVREGNDIVDKTNSSLAAVAAGSKEVVQLIKEVSDGSAEQARAISEMNQNIEQISGVIQENSASSEESAAAAEEMSAQAVVLNEIVGKFRLS